MIAFLFAAVTNLVSYWFSDRIVLAMYRAKEVGPGHPLHQMVAQLAQRAGLPMPRVYVIPDRSPNAFATGRNPSHAAVAATEGILAGARSRGTCRRPRPRARARPAPRHPDQLGGGDARRGDHDGRPHGVLLRRTGRSRRRQPDRRRADADSRAHRGHAGAGRHLAIARVRRRRRRARAGRVAGWSRPRASQDRGGRATGAASTPIPRRRTCSSSSRFRVRRCSHCSRRTRRPRSGSRRSSSAPNRSAAVRPPVAVEVASRSL